MSQTPAAPHDVPPLDANARLFRLWELGQPPDLADFLRQAGPLSRDQRLGVSRIDQQCRWQRRQGLPAEHYLALCPDVAEDAEAVVVLIVGEYLARGGGAAGVSVEELVARFPDH